MSVLLWIPAVIVAIGVALALWSASVASKIEAALPPEGRFVEVDGCSLHVLELGPANAPGPALVMIHGILGNLRHFTYAFAERLARDHRVILIDRPGWGWSTLAGARPGIGRQADMIAAALDRMGVEAPVLVGHSMGGAVSLAFELRHPGRARALALIAPYSQPVERIAPAFRSLVLPAWARPIVAWTLAVPLGIRTGAAKSAMAFAPDPFPEDFPMRGGGLLALRPTAFQSGAFEIAAVPPEMAAQTQRYGEIAIPVAILYGREDALLDPELHGRRTADAIPGASLELIDGGHVLQVCHVDETEAWLRGVLESAA